MKSKPGYYVWMTAIEGSALVIWKLCIILNSTSNFLCHVGNFLLKALQCKVHFKKEKKTPAMEEETM